MKKTLKNIKGITLVALVITIIILLILAGISIQALTNQGLFKKSQEAKEKTQTAEANQAKILNEYEDEINKYVTETKTKQKLADKVKVGDYVTYIPDTLSREALEKLKTNLNTYSGISDSEINAAIVRDELKWRVLDVTDNGEVKLISEKATTSEIELYGYNGYNNLVKLLDSACSTLYTNSKLATKVQNLKIKDVTDHMTTQPTLDTQIYTPTDIEYPKILEYEENQIVEKSTIENKLDVSSQNSFVDGSDISSTNALRRTYWSQDNMNYTDCFTNNKYYELFIANEKGEGYSSYCMSSRCVRAYSREVDFQIHVICAGGVLANSLYNSYGRQENFAYALRPTVTLNSNVQVISGDGSESTPFEIDI